MHLDTTVYPDLDEVPQTLENAEERADYVQRICGAWDFGIVPDEPTFALLAEWRAVFDRYPLRGSTAYHAFRASFGWPPIKATILETPWERADHLAGRTESDPCLAAL